MVNSDWPQKMIKLVCRQVHLSLMSKACIFIKCKLWWFQPEESNYCNWSFISNSLGENKSFSWRTSLNEHRLRRVRLPIPVRLSRWWRWTLFIQQNLIIKHHSCFIFMFHNMKTVWNASKHDVGCWTATRQRNRAVLLCGWYSHKLKSIISTLNE